MTTCWLSSRTESVATDFDGRLRRCRVVATARTNRDGDVLVAEVEPLLPGQGAGELVTLRRRWAEDRWQDTRDRWVSVFVGLVPRDVVARLRRGVTSEALLDTGEVASVGHGEVARTRELLPPSQEDVWEGAYRALERFASRQGHAQVPPDHREGDLGLGTWVVNQRRDHQEGRLPDDQAARLEALPGWEW